MRGVWSLPEVSGPVQKEQSRPCSPASWVLGIRGKGARWKRQVREPGPLRLQHPTPSSPGKRVPCSGAGDSPTKAKGRASVSRTMSWWLFENYLAFETTISFLTLKLNVLQLTANGDVRVRGHDSICWHRGLGAAPSYALLPPSKSAGVARLPGGDAPICQSIWCQRTCFSRLERSIQSLR